MQHGKFPVGARVRVIKSVIMYHTPMKRNEEYDVKGLEGVVIKYADEYEGMPVSANRPIQVQLEGSKKFTAHFEANELEHVE
ncbi:hypothetical protein CDCA_CDCA05G1708 [Cyanidium caldarium]|uniref:Ferredoxin thioredoxin reductase alpha chain domain-containing protein n=1 Tax=Cyanidium caldarium TaxID=2771 RepID=A0AAV9IV21_CYACA|nr:hypothetical protein CDCA_CDCA05G1708 [Cyanidium caldarium]